MSVVTLLLTSCQSWVWTGAHLHRSAQASPGTEFLRSCRPAPGLHKAELQISGLVCKKKKKNCLQVALRKWWMYGEKISTVRTKSHSSPVNHLQLQWRISLRLTLRSVVFVYQLCGVFYTLWASPSFHSVGKISAVLAICWYKQWGNTSKMRTE